MKNVKVVITGGAGFIGSHIVEYWANENVEIHVIDNLRSGNIKNIESFKNVYLHEVSITDRDAVFDILENVTYIHHLAALISVPESIQKPLDCVNINVTGLLNVLDAAVKHKAKKIIHSSSAAVYGENTESPKEISMAPKPKSPYGITKLDGEYYLQVYEENYNLKGTALRYFNVFGPRQDPKSQYAAAIPIFISKAIKNEPIFIYGDGEQTRDFVYVKDVVQANILAVKNEEASGVFNVGRGNAISINQIAKLIFAETKSKSKIIYKKARPGDIKHSLASIELAKLHLNYLPKYNLVDGLKDTIKYFVEVFTK